MLQETTFYSWKMLDAYIFRRETHPGEGGKARPCLKTYALKNKVNRCGLRVEVSAGAAAGLPAQILQVSPYCTVLFTFSCSPT